MTKYFRFTISILVLSLIGPFSSCVDKSAPNPFANDASGPPIKTLASSPQTYPIHTNNSYLSKAVDVENGVTCYTFGGTGISCVRDAK